MHLAYIDDSDTKQKNCDWQVMSAVLIEDRIFKLAEIGLSSIAEDLIPEDRRERFEEFHACELYGGYGIFEGIPQALRFGAIERLLGLVKSLDISIIYGAVDLERLRSTPYGSADPVDVAFRACMGGINSWIGERIEKQGLLAAEQPSKEGELSPMMRSILHGILEELVLIVVDDCDGKIKSTLQKSFRQSRPARRAVNRENQISHFHDEMYFGYSRYSVGLQLADLCSYFICRHLGGDSTIDGFYNWIEPHIKFSGVSPAIEGVS